MRVNSTAGRCGLILAILTAARGAAFASTISVFDVLVATETLTVVGTTTVQGGAFSVGASTFSVIDGSVLIGTTTERGQFHMAGAALGGYFPEFIWLPSSGALRVGSQFDPGLWDSGNIGAYSVTLGANGFARGRGAFVAGITNYAYSDYGVVAGGFDNEVDDVTTAVGGGANNIAPSCRPSSGAAA